MNEDYVTKRSGKKEVISFDKILTRIKKLGNNELDVNYTVLTVKIIDRLYPDIPTGMIDELTAQQCASLSTKHPDYGILASRVLISNHQKNTDTNFFKITKQLFNFRDVHCKIAPLISKKYFNIVKQNKTIIQGWLDYDRDFLLDYFGFKTLERAYLMKINKKIVERPQHMWMRVSIGIHGDDLKRAKETYDFLSNKYFTHATPTLFNAGTPRSQLSSCYLIAMEDDSISGIYNTLTDCALISKWAGGIGLHIHNVRASGSHIRGTNGTSNGIVPMLRVFNGTARYCDQGGGKRKGSFAIYMEPWHGDIENFLEMKKNHGDEEMRARDLFYALWIPDLFMKRVMENKKWTLMCPDQCPGLSDVYGDDFVKLYEKYEAEGKGIKTIAARKIWLKILDSQIETGTPYMLYKDSCNKKSNQKNLGTIKSSNLCCVKGDTLLLTDKGHLKIETLKDNKVNVWNGKEFNEVTVKQTNDSEELLTIDFSDGSTLTCTKYHKFYIQTKYPSKMKQDIIKSKSVELIEAKDLKTDMKLIKCAYPIINNKKELQHSYTNGFFCGDGTYSNNQNIEQSCQFKSLKGKSYCKRHIDYQKDNNSSELCQGISYRKKPMVSLYGEKIKLLEYLDYRSHGEEKNNKLNVCLVLNLKEKFFVPMKYSLQSKLDWFAGYCDADGCIMRNGTNQSLQVSSIHKEFLMNIKLMLQTCGISCKVMLNMNERLSYLPNGKGGMQYYGAKELWRILINSNDLQSLIKIGFSPKRLIVKEHSPQRNASAFVKISKITDNNEIDKTFCFNESKRHAGIFNGVITSQCEIVEYSNSEETAVCNLASIGLSKFIKPPSQEHYNYIKSIKVYTKTGCKWCDKTKLLLNGFEFEEINLADDKRQEFYKKYSKSTVNTMPQIFINDERIGGYQELKDILKPTFDYELLHKITKIVTFNLNKVIDINFYPTPKTKLSNQKHRPVGIGVQGLADTFALMDIAFNSPEAKKINKNIFETIYHAALESSMEIAIEDGSYQSFENSPASKGILQFDMWDVIPSNRYSWKNLKQKIKKYGLRNSLLVAPMPTASTSQILGNNECFEPFTSNIYVRRTLAGEFVMVNKYLIRELLEHGKWTEDIKNQIIKNNGSIQNIDQLSQKIKDKYKTVWEIPMKDIIDMSADRGAFICQSQSLNLWMKNPTYDKLTSMHMYAWKKGLKTGLYYLRTKAKASPQQFTIEPENTIVEAEDDVCDMCSG
jgi:ribonucleoside-diphosphate reductase alpha chain